LTDRHPGVGADQPTPAAPAAPAAPDVSVVLPVYNEAGHVARELGRIASGLEASRYSYEIIVVDDGSTDSTPEALAAAVAEIGEVEFRLIRFGANRGTGAARKAGTRAARGRCVVWTDCDMTYPNEEIPRLVAALDRGYDQVVGVRSSEQGTARALRGPAKWFIRRLASYLSGTSIPDLNSGLRVFRREVGDQFLHLLPSGFSCVTTMTMTFLASGYSVHHVPIEYAPRAGRSKFHWWADTRRYLLQVVRMVLMYNPLRVFMPVGLTLLAASFAKTVYDLIDKGGRIATNTLVVLFAAGVVIMIGLLSDLLVQLTRPRDDVEPARPTQRDGPG